MRHDGPPGAVAPPHRDDRRSACASTASRSTTATPTAGRWRPGRSGPPTDDIEPDLSNAAPFLDARDDHRRPGARPGLARRTTQAGDALREILTAWAAEVDASTTGA